MKFIPEGIITGVNADIAGNIPGWMAITDVISLCADWNMNLSSATIMADSSISATILQLSEYELLRKRQYLICSGCCVMDLEYLI
jgi:hypothetical protein